MVQKSFTRLFYDDLMDGSLEAGKELEGHMKEHRNDYNNSKLYQELLKASKPDWLAKVSLTI